MMRAPRGLGTVRKYNVLNFSYELLDNCSFCFYINGFVDLVGLKAFSKVEFDG